MKQISKIIILNCWKRKNEGLIVEKIIKAIIQEMNVDIDVEISYDDGSLNIWGNYKQAMKIPSKEEERFRFIIQDDMLISRQGIEKMIYLLQFFQNDCFVSFYVPKNKGYKECTEKGHRVLLTHTNFWTQAFCFPSIKIDEIIEWGDKFKDDDLKIGRWEDTRIRNYCVNTNTSIYAILPSLFQHLGAYRSALGISGEIGKNKRYSDQFQPDKDIYKVDWKKEMDNPFKTEKPTKMKDYHQYTI